MHVSLREKELFVDSFNEKCVIKGRLLKSVTVESFNEKCVIKGRLFKEERMYVLSLSMKNVCTSVFKEERMLWLNILTKNVCKSRLFKEGRYG